jgi:hypothetical protein
MSPRKIHIILIFLILTGNSLLSQNESHTSPAEGFELRIKSFIDSLKIFDTHEHLMDPEIMRELSAHDFTLLLIGNSYDDLISAGMPDSLFDTIFNSRLAPAEKWKIIEPYWANTFNTGSNRILTRAVNDLYNIPELNPATVQTLSTRMEKNFNLQWVDHVLRDLCRIEYVIEDVDMIEGRPDYIKHATRFCDWLSITSKKVIDSLAIMQVEPIFTLEDFSKSLERAFDKALNEGMTVVKVNLAYQRTLSIDNVTTEAAKKVFRTLVNGNEDHVISFKDAKPLQDYMVHQLLILAGKHHIPVAFHTGLQAGESNYIANSNPVLLTNLFKEFKDVRFVLFHGGYPFGGELSALAKNYQNVYIDMNWTYAISPSYAERYLSEWLETVPVNKIMAFGGDQRLVELTYGNLMVAKQVVTNVLIRKIRDGLLTESEAKNVASKIMYENAMKFYNIK